MTNSGKSRMNLRKAAQTAKRGRALGQRLRELYRHELGDAIPAEFIELLMQADEARTDRRDEGENVANGQSSPNMRARPSYPRGWPLMPPPAPEA